MYYINLSLVQPKWVCICPWNIFFYIFHRIYILYIFLEKHIYILYILRKTYPYIPKADRHPFGHIYMIQGRLVLPAVHQ